MSSDLIRNIALFMPALLISLSVHEFAHAWMATRLGDSTASNEGRLTLSPVSHIDPIGSIVFPLILISSGMGVFGWAKPVPFVPSRFRRGVSMRRGAAMTAAAGPLSNLLLAGLALLLLRVVLSTGLGDSEFLVRLLHAMFQLNVLLAVFNLVPLPPLDGSYLLPASMDGIKESLEQYSFLIIFAVFFLPVFGGRSLGSFVLEPAMALVSLALRFVTGLGM